ncbi:MAG: aspartate-semialdehyde dehydrogenase [Pseudomonas sp.]|nr:aspartate-semialdehyde dehydrogenase [Pseudomonas sp.]
MLPPIPQGLHPVTSQHDVEKPKPAVAPVTPVQENAKSAELGLEKDELSAAQERAREEQRRRQQRQPSAEEQDVDVDDVDNEYGKTGELSRQGVWVDVKV